MKVRLSQLFSQDKGAGPRLDGSEQVFSAGSGSGSERHGEGEDGAKGAGGGEPTAPCP